MRSSSRLILIADAAEPQVQPDGLLADDEFQAQPVDLAIHRVDKGVPQNDRVGELPGRRW